MRILRMPETASRVGLGRTVIYQRIASGEFPKPLKLGPRAIGFLEHEIDAWLEGLPRAGEAAVATVKAK